MNEAFRDLIFEKGRLCFYILLQVLIFITVNCTMLLHVFKYILNTEDWGVDFLVVI